MKIEPVYTLCINNGDEHINASTEVIVRCTDGEIINGLFESCTDEGIWIEAGTDENDKVYIIYGEIESIEEK